MSWITFIWALCAAICLTLAYLYTIVWLRQRNDWENLLFTVVALSSAVLTIFEVNLMQAQTSAVYGELLRWMHVSVASLIVALVWFIRFYLGAGRLWLAWVITGLRALVLLPNFLYYPNATFAEISGLRYVVFMGETFSVPVGEMNPWRVLILLSVLLLMLYVLDAVAAKWKLDDRRRAMVIGGATVLTIILGATFSELMTAGVLPGPFIALAFLPIVLAMSFELSLDLLRARELARTLQETQRRMSLAAKAASLELWEWNASRDEVWISDTSRRRTRQSFSKPLTLDDYLQNVHLDDREATREAITQALQDGNELQTEFRIPGPNGDTRWLSARGQVEYDNDGKPLRMRGVSYDITSRKNAEAELQERRYDLAQVSRVLTLGQLSSAIAHEINQPLGAILRNTEAAELFLRQTPPDLEELEVILKDIRKDEQRAAAVIESMRSFLMRRELHFESIDMAKLIEQVTQLINTELQLRSTKLRTDITRFLPRVLGDRIHLQQVILNLLINSLDALDDTAKDERNIIIRVHKNDDGEMEVSVIDNGKGIDQQQLHQVFEPLHTTKEKGTGIGLAISKSIVESHGGVISAHNRSEGGAVFTFTLKVAQEGVET